MQTRLDFTFTHLGMTVLLTCSVLMVGVLGSVFTPSLPSSSFSVSSLPARLGLFPGNVDGLSLDHLLVLSLGIGYGALQLRQVMTQDSSVTPPDEPEPAFLHGEAGHFLSVGRDAPTSDKRSRRHP